MSTLTKQSATFWRDLYQSFCQMVGNQPTLRHYFGPIREWFSGVDHAELSKCQVLSTEWTCADMVTLTLKVPTSWSGFEAGQHVLLTLQHDGRYITRPFSISSGEGMWRKHRQIQISCKVKSQGHLTPLLASLEHSQRVFISNAQGQFIIPATNADVVLLCAGSGITPMRAYLQTMTQQVNAQQQCVTRILLYYRYRGEQHASFSEELRSLQSTFPNLTLILSNSIEEPNIDWHMLPEWSLLSNIYLCGPDGFMQAAKDALALKDVEPQQIHQEFFGPIPMKKNNDSNETEVEAHFVRDGMAYSITTNTDTNLLESAIDSGVEPPYGCRIGVCFQCVCNKVSGQIKDLRTGELSGTGKEQIQLCVSAPVTEVTVEY